MSGYYPQKWKEIHSKALTDDRTIFNIYMQELCATLACSRCRAHLQYYLRAFPIVEGEDLFTWSWKLHNNVNARLRKPILPLEAARALYSLPTTNTTPN